VTTAAFSTHAANELLLAFVSAVTVIQRVVHVARVAHGVPLPPPLSKRETLPGVAAVRRKGH